MKKLIVCLLMLCMPLSLAACSVDNNPDSTQGSSTAGTSGSNTENHPDAPSVTVNGTKLQLFAQAEPIISALGEAKSTSQTPSCAFPGEADKLYTYDNIVLQTYTQDGTDYVYSFWFRNDLVATDEGIRIGSTKEAVEAAYGADTFNGASAYIVSGDGGELQIILEDGAVADIIYTVVLGQ